MAVFENEFGTVYPDRLRFPAVPGDAGALNGDTLLLSGVLRVAWLYGTHWPPQAAPLSKRQFWMAALVAMNLLMMPIVNSWAVSSRKWRVVVILKDGTFVRSAHLGNWGTAEVFAKAARQATKKLA